MTALTVYLTSTNDTTLTTARTLASAAPSSATTVSSGQFAKNGTGWTELYSQGGNATLAGTEPAPSGHGFLFDVTTLEGYQIAAGTWTVELTLGAVATGFTVTAYVRVWKYSGGTYTQFTSGGTAQDILVASAWALTTSQVTKTATQALDAMSFAAGDKLYLDVVLDITTGSSSNTASNRVIKLSENGGVAESAASPGYVLPPGAAALSGSGTLGANPSFTYTNSAEGGTNGTLLTQGSSGNTGGTSGSYFDRVVASNEGTTPAFDTSHPAHGTLGYHFAAVSGATEYTSVEWRSDGSIPGNQTDLYARAYFYVTAAPTVATPLILFMQGTTPNGASWVQMSPDQTLWLGDPGAGAYNQYPTAIPLNTLFRVELYTHGDATAGQASWKVFVGANVDGTTPDYSYTSAATRNTAGALGRACFGFPQGENQTWDLWADDLGISNVTWLGSAGSGTSHSGSAALTGTGSLSASSKIAGSAALSGTGSLSASGVTAEVEDESGAVITDEAGNPLDAEFAAGSAHSGSAALTGSGTLSATGKLAGTAALTGSGTLTASGKVVGTAALAGTGSLTATGKLAGSAALSGTGSLTATGKIAGSAALSGSGTLSPGSPQTYIAGTYTISAGGYYGPAQIGLYRSNDPAATGPGLTSTGVAVYVNTTAPVTIEGVHLMSSVAGVPCIYAIPGAQVTVRNCWLEAYHANGYACWFDATSTAKPSITFEHNYVHGGTIAVLAGTAGQLSSFSCRYNIIEDIYGRLASSSDPLRQAIQIANVYGPNIDIGWNKITNHWRTSCVEDVITIYGDPGVRSGGTAASRMQIHDNLIDGGYPYPGQAGNYSGSGSLTDVYDATTQVGGFVDVHDNQYVALCNGGPGIASGESTYIFNNRVVCSGRLPDDSGWAPVSTNAQGCGAGGFASETLWDGTEGDPGWGDNKIYNNVFGQMRADGTRADWWTDNTANDPMALLSGNLKVTAASILITNPWYTGDNSSATASSGAGTYTITNADQDTERTRFANKVTAAGVVLGPYAATSALSGTGTLTAPAVIKALAALSGTGSLSAPATLKVPAALTGTGTLSAVSGYALLDEAGGALLDEAGGQITDETGPTSGSGSAALSGTGSLSAAGVLTGSAALSGTGSLAASGVLTGSAALSGTGSLAASGKLTGSAALSGSGSLGLVPGFAASASLSGSGSLAVVPGFAGSAALSGTGTLSAAVTVRVPVSLSGTGTLSAAATVKVPAALSGSGALAAPAALLVPAALSGAGSLAATFILKVLAALSGTGTLSASGTVTSPAVHISSADYVTATESEIHYLADGDYASAEDGPEILIPEPEVWSATAGTLTWSPDYGHDGQSYSAKLVPAGGAASLHIAGLGPVVPGAQYTVVIYAFAPAALSVPVAAEGIFRDGSGNPLGAYVSSGPVALSPGVWTAMGYAITAPARAASFEAVAYLTGTPLGTDITYWDDPSGVSPGRIDLVAKDSASANDGELSRWPRSQDTIKASESQRWSGPLKDADTAHAAESVRPFHFAGADTASAAEDPHGEVIDVYPAILGQVGPGGYYRVVIGGREVLRSKRLDGTFLRRARELAGSTEVRFVSSADAATARDAGPHEPAADVHADTGTAVEVAVETGAVAG